MKLYQVSQIGSILSNSYGNDPGRFIQVQITGFCSASACVGNVCTGEYSKQWTTKQFQTEDSGKATY